MQDDEQSIVNILETIPNEIKETTATQNVGNTILVLVDPGKVEAYVRALIDHGVTQIQTRRGLCVLDPELARNFATTAREILEYSVSKLKEHKVSLVKALNYGSSVTGIVRPASDIDIGLNLLTARDMETTGRILRFDTNFRSSLFQIPKIRILETSYELSVPSIYKQKPGEMWIPQAHDRVKIPFQNT